MRIEQATWDDLPGAAVCIAESFRHDPLQTFFFGTDERLRVTRITAFIGYLMEARLALGMPVLALRTPDGIGGLAMGYGTTFPDWPADVQSRFDAYADGIPGLTDRFDAYGAIADRFAPETPCFYLGVLGVHPGLQGKGYGRDLVAAYAALSDADPGSTGVYLETGSEESLRFYLRVGFELLGTAPLGEGALWCLFLPRGRAVTDR